MSERVPSVEINLNAISTSNSQGWNLQALTLTLYAQSFNVDCTSASCWWLWRASWIPNFHRSFKLNECRGKHLKLSAECRKSYRVLRGKCRGPLSTPCIATGSLSWFLATWINSILCGEGSYVLCERILTHSDKWEHLAFLLNVQNFIHLCRHRKVPSCQDAHAHSILDNGAWCWKSQSSMY